MTLAMAAVVLPGDPITGSPVLAVDSGRLTTAALWPDGTGMTAAAAAAKVRPPVADPATSRSTSTSTG